MTTRKFLRDSFGYAFSQYVVRATLMLRGLIAARLLGPTGYGTWNAIQIMMDWGTVAPAGTQHGLDQLVPPAIVAGDPLALARIKRTALFNISLLSALFVAACLLWGGLGRSHMLHDEWGVLGIAAAMVCAYTTNIAYYQTSIMRSHGDITTASGWMALQGAIGGVLGLALIPWLRQWGLLFGWLAGCLVAFTFSTIRSRRWAPMLPAPSSEVTHLVRVGFPMYVFTVGWQLVSRTADRMIILRFLGTDQLGYYSLSVMALTFLLYLPDSVAYVLYPQLLSAYRVGGNDPESIRRRIERVLQVMSIAVPVLCGFAALSAGPVVAVLLPKYRPGVQAVRVLCFGAPVLAFGNFASIVLMTMRRYRQLTTATVVGMAVFVALDLGAVNAHLGLDGVAGATLAAYTINGAALLFLALHGLVRGSGRTLGLLLRLLAPPALALVLTLLLERFVPPAPHGDVLRVGLRLVAQLAAFALVYGALVKPLTRQLGMVALVAELNLPLVGPLVRRIQRARGLGAGR